MTLVTNEQRKYLRRLIAISFGLAFTDEVSSSVDLINRVLKNGVFRESDKVRLNNLNNIFNYSENKHKHFL